MDNETYDKLMEISKKVWECRRCDFHRTPKSREIKYKPDAPLDFKKDCDYKSMIVGINPGWDSSDEKYWYKAYKEDNFEQYKETLKEETQRRHENNKRNPYRDGITRYFNAINKQCNPNSEEIKSENIYDHVFWANLSFCSSQSPWKREFSGTPLPCRVYSEEIPNCLRNNFLKNYIEALDPELIIFLTSQATGFIYFKLLLAQLFDIDPYRDILTVPEEKTFFQAQKRSDGTKITEIEVQLIPCKVKDRNILFLPHPNYRFNGEMKSKAIKQVCANLRSL